MDHRLNRTHRAWVLVFSIGLFAGLAAGVVAETPAEAGKAYLFGVFPYLSARQLGDSYGPVAAEFRRVLGVDVQFTSTANYEDFTRGLAEERFDIAMIQPFDYVKAVDHYNYLPLARVDADLRANFVVRSDSAIQNIEELRGTRVALPSQTAAISQVALKALQDAGLEIGKDVRIHHFKSFGSCMQDVLIGGSSACATGLAAKKLFEKRMDTVLRIVHKTPPIPHMAFVVHNRVPQNVRATLKATIINWKQTEEGQRIVRGTRLPGYRELVDKDYDVVRSFSD